MLLTYTTSPLERSEGPRLNQLGSDGVWVSPSEAYMFGYLVTSDQRGHPQIVQAFRGRLRGREVVIPERKGLDILAELGGNFFTDESQAQVALRDALMTRMEELEFEMALIREEIGEIEEAQKADRYVSGQDRLTSPRGGA